MGDHPIAALHTKIHIEIWHGHPLGVEESLKQQVIFQRVKVCNTKSIGHKRAPARTTAWPHRYVVGLSPSDKLHHDQKIAGKAHLVDDVQLEIQPILIALWAIKTATKSVHSVQAQALLKPLHGYFFEIVLGGLLIRNRIIR